MAFEEPVGILPGTPIEFVEEVLKVPADRQLKGRVLNGFGLPIDNKGILGPCNYNPVAGRASNPFDRRRISTQLDVGVRAINSLLTVGIGQRMGIFAGSGVGKSVLLGMITRFTKADVVVVGLIGERGREIKEFLEENIGPDSLHKTVIIAAPINTSPLERTNGILTAVTIAEYFRDLGQNVLLIIDSLTRYAHALRNMYALFGEPVSAKGYSPSVFAKLSQLAERCGNGNSSLGGSITAFFTVLIEADNMNDPIADHVRSILDGHIVLSRELAEATHFPAIDICKSISRVMPNVVKKEHLNEAMHFKKVYSHYLQNEDLIKIGMYKSGTDQLLDEGIRLINSFNQFLKQDYNEDIAFERSILELQKLLAGE
ncbi:FliI/YscN family ATPase [Legionella norrlandica]|uniref:FliI/YscN family ATPase n=1 Tax=Legionella norrlandica TaxID=1498499 RepID=UPI0019D3831A|nr:FliI/YscN family ATPase [Legionella norrlandica]